MSMIGSMSAGGTPFFQELKKQASFFLKEKIKNARLALTDVTPAELLAEEVTNSNPWSPDTRTMSFLSRAAFEIDDYWRIVEVLHKRLSKFDWKHWRESYKSLILLEHLLTHGPESFSEEFQSDREIIQELQSFQYIDERGFNWGLTVRRKSERVLKLLEKGPLLAEERDRARKLTRGIQGFGSFTQRSASYSTSENDLVESSFGFYGRSNSHYSNYSVGPDESSVLGDNSQKENLTKSSNFQQMIKRAETDEKEPLKENSAENDMNWAKKKIEAGVLPKEIPPEESNQNIEFLKEHPFNYIDNHQSKESLLLSQT